MTSSPQAISSAAGRPRAVRPARLSVAAVELETNLDVLLDHFASAEWDRSVFHDEPGGPRMLGLGRAAEVRVGDSHVDRFDESWRQIQRITDHLEVPETLRGQIRWFGGGSFEATNETEQEPWQGFGNASWFLPRVLVTESGGRTFGLIAAPAKEHAAIQKRLESLELSRDSRSSPLPEVVERDESANLGQWTQLVQRALAELETGSLDKVVTARRVTVQLSAAAEPARVLRVLREQAVDCTVFAVRFGDSTFLGASPELLVRKQGRSVHTDALAGTLGRTQPRAEERLKGSEKDRREHDIVVREITRVLKPLCDEIHVPREPQVLALRRMLHLRTPIRGELSDHRSVLELVGRLHPTPAVGGLPTRDALRFLEQEEDLNRGWYASPFGWVDGQGDGCFLVALRSALLTGSKCHIYAGAGIVKSSVPELEFQETELKMGAMLGALGLGG